ncbi:hypothetical protein LZK75_11220 [Rhizobium leguminosarum]|nr:hypothetical protein LZK75_11220 [Rhizobium leguminosarum]
MFRPLASNSRHLPSVARALVLQKATASMNRKAAALRATFKIVEGTPPLLRLPPP